MSKISEETLHKILDDNSFHKYHAYFNGAFHNHLAHGIVALFRLGATEEQIKSHIQNEIDV